MVGRRAALLGIDSTQLCNLLDQRNLHGAVGAEESGVFAVLININLDVLGHPRLSAGNAGITGGIGSSGFYILNAQFCAALFEQLLTSRDSSVTQVPLEGDVHKGLGALLGSLVHNGGAHGNFVHQHADISSSSDNSGIFCADTGDEQDVVTGFLDLVDGGSSAGNSLHEDNSLHIRVSSHVGHGSDGLLGLGGEVVGISSGDDHVAVLGLHVLSGLILLLTLGHSAGDDTDLVVHTGSGAAGFALGFCLGGVTGSAAGDQGENHSQSKKHAQDLVELFHFEKSSL